MTLKPVQSDVSSRDLLPISWLNTILYTSQVALSVYYLYHFTTTRWLRYCILSSLLLDGACSLVSMVGLYLFMINPGPPLIYTWAVPVVVLLTYASALISQSFFCRRYWMISRNKWITAWIVFLIAANMLCILVATIYLTLHPQDFGPKVPLMLSTLCAATDLTIASSLAWTCLHIESSYASTRNILRRVMIQALTCGITTAIFTSLMSIFMFSFWDVFCSLFTVLGRIYSLTVLITVILLKVLNRSDASSSRIDGDLDCSEPTFLGPISSMNTLDTETGKGQSSTNESATVDHSTEPRFASISNGQSFIRTV